MSTSASLILGESLSIFKATGSFMIVVPGLMALVVKTPLPLPGDGLTVYSDFISGLAGSLTGSIESTSVLDRYTSRSTTDVKLRKEGDRCRANDTKRRPRQYPSNRKWVLHGSMHVCVGHMDCVTTTRPTAFHSQRQDEKEDSLQYQRPIGNGFSRTTKVPVLCSSRRRSHYL